MQYFCILTKPAQTRLSSVILWGKKNHKAKKLYFENIYIFENKTLLKSYELCL